MPRYVPLQRIRHDTCAQVTATVDKILVTDQLNAETRPKAARRCVLRSFYSQQGPSSAELGRLAISWAHVWASLLIMKLSTSLG